MHVYVCFCVCSVYACICAALKYFSNKVNSDFYLTNPLRNFCFKTFYKKDPHIKSLSLDGRGFKNLFLFLFLLLFLDLLGLILTFLDDYCTPTLSIPRVHFALSLDIICIHYCPL